MPLQPSWGTVQDSAKLPKPSWPAWHYPQRPCAAIQAVANSNTPEAHVCEAAAAPGQTLQEKLLFALLHELCRADTTKR